jgi:N-methylhydantoinase B/oxoprolinase/acetone carboxylase alpha subunit
VGYALSKTIESHATAAPEPATRVDPVTFRVIGGALDTISKGMALTLFRLAGSNIIRDMEDVGTGLTDADGREISESDANPMHSGAAPYYIQGILDTLGDDIRDGDVIMHNDPYRGATHTNDVGIAVPIFWEGKLTAFASANGHLLDIGSANIGISPDAKDVFAEGARFNALRLYRDGVHNEELWRHILHNFRVPEMNRRDIDALIGACEYGKRRLHDVFARYGVETTMAAARRWMDYSEARLRSVIREIPNGEYRAPIGWIDDDGVNRGVRLRLEVTVRIEDDSIEIDLTGSNPEVSTGCNVPFEGSTLPAVNFTIRTLCLDEALLPEFVPQNSGMARPVRVVCPEGLLYRPRFPRAAVSRFNQIQRLADSIVLAFAEAAPDRAIAGSSAHSHVPVYSGQRTTDAEPWIFMEVFEGAFGGGLGGDGADAVEVLMGNTRNNPIEDLEMRFPLRCEQYELRPEAPGAGQWRGGKGAIRTLRALDNVTVSIEGDRHTDPPAGVLGGHDGSVASVRRTRGADAEDWPGKLTGQSLAPGDTLTIVAPNAAGYGDPLQRDPALVLEDVLEEYITREHAAAVYGVLIDANTTTVAELATEARRAELRARRGHERGGRA